MKEQMRIELHNETEYTERISLIMYNNLRKLKRG